MASEPSRTQHVVPTPYKEHPEMYEQACIREVMRGLAGLEVVDPAARIPLNIHEVRLDGSYPETKLVLKLSRGGASVEMEWALWRDEFGSVLPDDRNRGSPDYIAGDVMIQVYEL